MTSKQNDNIKITKISTSKINDVDFNNLTFGRIFSDHMFECNFKNGAWQTPEIKPYQKIEIDPTARVLHYGQAVFEGMKAYKDDNDNILLFRPKANFERINKSAARLAMPEFPENYFMEGLQELLKIDKEWIKKGFGNSIYIRPVIFATEAALVAAPAEEYKFMIILSPAQSYFDEEVRVVIANKYSRSAKGGVGSAKAAGNYAAQFYPQKLAREEGYQQVVFTDADTHSYIEEGGAMNVFFRINDTMITAPVSERILDGITRKSLIQLMEDEGIKVEVRPITVEEIKTASKNGSLKEIFGSGTAAVITPILGFKHLDEKFELPKLEETFADKFKNKLMNIQYNKIEDKHHWRIVVK